MTTEWLHVQFTVNAPDGIRVFELAEECVDYYIENNLEGSMHIRLTIGPQISWTPFHTMADLERKRRDAYEHMAARLREMAAELMALRVQP